MPRLFDPFTLTSIMLRNRIGVSPMRAEERWLCTLHSQPVGAEAR